MYRILWKKLNSKIDSQDTYPYCNLNVKFTKERLQIVKSLISIYIIEFSKVYDISNEPDKHKKSDGFTAKILISIFGNNILLPLNVQGNIHI